MVSIGGSYNNTSTAYAYGSPDVIGLNSNPSAVNTYVQRTLGQFRGNSDALNMGENGLGEYGSEELARLYKEFQETDLNTPIQTALTAKETQQKALMQRLDLAQKLFQPLA